MEKFHSHCLRDSGTVQNNMLQLLCHTNKNLEPPMQNKIILTFSSPKDYLFHLLTDGG